MNPNDTTTNDKCHVCTEEQQCWECASDVSVPDTPRTDELLYGKPESNIGLSPQQAAFKIVDFARQLERELNEAKADVERLKKGKVFVDPKWIYDLETQLAKAHEELCQAGLREYGN